MIISHQIKKIYSFRTLFILLVLLNSLPIFIFSPYPSLDGPIHLYNVNLLKEIIIYNNPNINEFFSINPQLIPHWSSHILLSLFRLIFSSVVTEKLFLLILAFSLPLITYSIIKHISPHNIQISVFSLPFVYTFLFGLGFYNFCFGVVVFLYTLNYWIKRKNKSSILSIIGLLCLFTISYFAHIFVFILLFSSISLYSILHLINNL